MKTIEVTLYKFNELSADAQQKAIDNYRDSNHDLAWQDENRDTIEAFENVFPLKIKTWSYGGRGEGVEFSMTCSDEIEELTGQRLATYIWNNYKTDLYKGKYFSLWSKTEKSYKHYKDGYPVLKSRHSKIMLDNSCVLTGYCLDDNILAPVYAFLEKPNNNNNFKELMSECFDEWIKGCNDDIEWQNSDEYIKDSLESNDSDFTEDGEVY